MQNIAELIPEKHVWHQIKKSDPYSYVIDTDNQHLFYFGANHSHDPENHQYPVLRYFWNRFEESENGDKLVLVEGGLRTLQDDLGTAILRDGESGYVTYKANQAEIPVTCPEPRELEERNYLSLQFSQDEVQLYYFVRLVPSWHRKGKDWSFDEFYNRYYGEKFVKFAQENLPEWKGFDFSLDHMQHVYENTFQLAFDVKNLDWFKQIISHARRDHVTNLLSAECSRYRDIAIVTNALNEWEKGKSLFMCFGLSHAVFQENALRLNILD